MRERPGGKWREGRGGIGIGMGQGGYRAAILYSTLYLYSIYYCGDDLHGLDHLAGSQTTGLTSLASPQQLCHLSSPLLLRQYAFAQ